MLDKAGEEPARSATNPAPMSDIDLAALLTRAAEVVAAPDSRIASHRNTLAGQLIAEAAIRRARRHDHPLAQRRDARRPYRNGLGRVRQQLVTPLSPLGRLSVARRGGRPQAGARACAAPPARPDEAPDV
jgi:hypothetical protein